MYDFVFHNPVKIIFGKDTISNLANEIPQNSHVLFVYGGGSIKKNGVYEQVVKALSSHTFSEFGGIEPNPQYSTLMRAVALCKEKHIDFILAVGGGSVIDGAKFIAAAIDFVGDPWDILTKSAKIKTALPLGVVLTLPAAGSEMNCGSVVSRDKDKLFFANELVFPRFSIMDPCVTFSLPAKQTSNGVIDAFVHAMEQYLTYPVNAPVQDRMTEAVLLTLIEEGYKVLRESNNYDVRANLMWASTMALNGIIGVGVPQDWTTHMIGHEITALHGLDHGQTLAIILPALMEVRRDAKMQKILQYAERVWHITQGSEDQIIAQAIAKTRGFFEDLGIKTFLSDYGIGSDSIDPLIAQLQKHGRTALGEAQDIDLNISRQILLKSLVRP